MAEFNFAPPTFHTLPTLLFYTTNTTAKAIILTAVNYFLIVCVSEVLIEGLLLNMNSVH